MTRNVFIVALSTLILNGVRVEAMHDLSSGIDAAAVANNALLSNPPLPMLYYSRGDYRVSIAPFVFSGTLERVDSSSTKGSGDFDGWGGGGTVSVGLGRKWGIYGLVAGSNAEGDFSYHDPATGAGNKVSEISDMDATYLNASLGVVYQFFGDKEGGFSLPVFFGPLLSMSSVKQRYRDRNRSTFALETDADLEVNLTNPGYFVGAQASLPVGKYFRLNPFVIYGANSKSDVSPEIATVRLETPGAEPRYLQRIRSGEKIGIPNKFAAIGINLFFKPWGLSMNLTAPLVRKAILEDEDAKMTLLTLSWSFGHYIK